MKKTHLISTVAVIVFMFCCNSIIAQDFAKTNPQMNDVLADTSFLRATEVTLEPGQKSDVHSHPAHFFYALTTGKLIVHYTDGKNEPYNLTSGDSDVSAPERPHWVENVGTSTIKFLIVELKEHPYTEAKKR